MADLVSMVQREAGLLQGLCSKPEEYPYEIFGFLPFVRMSNTALIVGIVYQSHCPIGGVMDHTADNLPAGIPEHMGLLPFYTLPDPSRFQEVFRRERTGEDGKILLVVPGGWGLYAGNRRIENQPIIITKPDWERIAARWHDDLKQRGVPLYEGMQ